MLEESRFGCNTEKNAPLALLDECGHRGSFPVSIASAFCRQKLKMLLQTLCAGMKEREVSLMKLIFTLIDNLGGCLSSFHLLNVRLHHVSARSDTFAIAHPAEESSWRRKQRCSAQSHRLLTFEIKEHPCYKRVLVRSFPPNANKNGQDCS